MYYDNLERSLHAMEPAARARLERLVKVHDACFGIETLDGRASTGLAAIRKLDTSDLTELASHMRDNRAEFDPCAVGLIEGQQWTLDAELAWRAGSPGSSDALAEAVEQEQAEEHALLEELGEEHFMTGAEREFHRMMDKQELWNVLNALVEVGVPLHLLADGTAAAQLLCALANPHLSTDNDDDFAEVLGFIGMPFEASGTMLTIGTDWTGFIHPLKREPVFGPKSLEEAHVSLLLNSDYYWHLLPARIKTREFVTVELPKLFRVSRVHDIPRPRLRELAVAFVVDATAPPPVAKDAVLFPILKSAISALRRLAGGFVTPKA